VISLKRINQFIPFHVGSNLILVEISDPEHVFLSLQQSYQLYERIADGNKLKSDPVNILGNIERQIPTIDLGDVNAPHPVRVFIIFNDQYVLC
jgi:hypothetical protein